MVALLFITATPVSTFWNRSEGRSTMLGFLFNPWCPFDECGNVVCDRVMFQRRLTYREAKLSTDGREFYWTDAQELVLAKLETSFRRRAFYSLTRKKHSLLRCPCMVAASKHYENSRAGSRSTSHNSTTTSQFSWREVSEEVRSYP